MTERIKNRIVITGGGTGGHVYPALAVSEALQDDPQVESILYIGVNGHLEERLAKKQGLEFVGLNVSGLPRQLSPSLLRWPMETALAVREAHKTLQLFRPTAMLGTGGYASAPPLMAAMLSSLPFIVHEPDSYPGIVNKLFASTAAVCSLGMESAAARLPGNHNKIMVSGNPVRKSFLKPTTRDEAAAAFSLMPRLKTVLITGGSQGAQALNESVCSALPALLDNEIEMQVIHQVGEKNIEQFKQQLPRAILEHKRYRLMSYIEDMALAYRACDLSFCRAGAMTIAELSCTGTAAVFVPYPFATQNHQMHNARFMESKGCAQVIPQNELSGKSLTRAILGLLTDSGKLLAMQEAMRTVAHPDAAVVLAEKLKTIALPVHWQGT